MKDHDKGREPFIDQFRPQFMPPHTICRCRWLKTTGYLDTYCFRDFCGPGCDDNTGGSDKDRNSDKHCVTSTRIQSYCIYIHRAIRVVSLSSQRR